jgi:hypothetical protein
MDPHAGTFQDGSLAARDTHGFILFFLQTENDAARVTSECAADRIHLLVCVIFWSLCGALREI